MYFIGICILKENLDNIDNEWVKFNFGQFSIPIDIDLFPDVFNLFIAGLFDSEDIGDTTEEWEELTFLELARVVRVELAEGEVELFLGDFDEFWAVFH